MSNKQNTQTKKSGGRKTGPLPPKGSTKSRQNNTKVIGRSHAQPVVRSKPIRSSRQPKQSFIKNGIRIEMEELIGPIKKPQTEDTLEALIKIMRLRINPGSKKTFNWLSTIAPSYENYKFLKCQLVYLPRTSSLTVGSIIMSPDYDAEDGDVAVTEQALFSNKGTVDKSLWEESTLNLNPAAMNRLFKSHACMSDERFDLTSQDAKTIDAAQVHICVETTVNPAEVYGKLVIRYVVDLTDPQNPTDPVNKGGVLISGPSLAVNSTTPLLNALPIPAQLIAGQPIGMKADPGFFLGSFNMPQAVFPNATLGQFIRDYSGTMSMLMDGTGFSGFGPGASNVYVGPEKNLNLPAGSVGDVLQAFNVIMEGEGTTARQERFLNIVAKAGDLLRFKTGPATTITDFQAVMGGSSALSFDL